MTDIDYHKFGSIPQYPPNQPYQYPSNQPPQYPPNQPPQYNSINQQYYPPPQGYPPQQQTPPLGQYGQYPPGQPSNYVIVQPVSVMAPLRGQPQPIYQSTLNVLLAFLLITIIYQIVVLIFLGINGGWLQFPGNVLGGFLCAIFDEVVLLICYRFFKKSNEMLKTCRNAMILFVLSLVLFILTYVITYSTRYYYVGRVLYYYGSPVYYVVLQVIFRVIDLVLAISYMRKRYRERAN